MRLENLKKLNEDEDLNTPSGGEWKIVEEEYDIGDLKAWQDKGEGEPGEGEGEGEPGEGEEGEGEGKPGEGEEGEGSGKMSDDAGWNEIDAHNKKANDKMAGDEELSHEDAVKEAEAEAKRAKERKAAAKGGRGGSTGSPTSLDYKNVQPTYKWAALIKQFIGNPKETTEQSYAKLGRGSITGIHTASQIGAGAPKPGDVKFETKQMDTAFVVDTSGSMSAVIAKAFANINLLLTDKRFEKSLFTLIKFSGMYTVWKGNLRKDVAGQVSSTEILKKPPEFTHKMSKVFMDHDSGATNFGPQLAKDIKTLLNAKYNVLIFSDSDLSSGDNGDELVGCITHKLGKMFVLFDSRSTWIKFRERYGINTANISYMEED